MTASELLKAAAAGNPPPLLFFYGAESFLMNRTFEQLRDLIVPPESRDFNYQQDYARDINPANLMDSVQTLPVFARHRMVVIKAAHEMSAAMHEGLMPLLENPIPETVLLFMGTKIDSRRKFFQRFKKTGVLVEFKPLYDNQLPAFVRDESGRMGLTLTEEAMRLFCRRVGTGLEEIVGQLHKLQNYMGAETLIDVEHVRQMVTDSHQESIFDLANAVGQRQTEKALILLRRMLDDGEPPLRILTMVVRHFRQLWKTHEGLANNTSNKDLARQVGINPYFLDGLVRQAKATNIDYPSVFEHCLQTDLALKSTGAQPEARLEQLIVHLCQT